MIACPLFASTSRNRKISFRLVYSKRPISKLRTCFRSFVQFNPSSPYATPILPDTRITQNSRPLVHALPSVDSIHSRLHHDILLPHSALTVCSRIGLDGFLSAPQPHVFTFGRHPTNAPLASSNTSAS